LFDWYHYVENGRTMSVNAGMLAGFASNLASSRAAGGVAVMA
jgi:hypothetical protein